MTDAESEDLPAVSNEQVVGMRERGYVALSNARIREISGHSKLMWFLPAFVLVLALVSIALWRSERTPSGAVLGIDGDRRGCCHSARLSLSPSQGFPSDSVSQCTWNRLQ